MKYIDNILNSITMYRLVLYVLTGLVIVAGILGAFGIVPYSPLALLYEAVVLVFVCWITNELFARVFKTHANVESVYITAFILALIISPPRAGEYLSIAPFLIWAGILSMAVKYILAINKKHIFNPAAASVAITALVLGLSATWWVGTLWMLPFVAIGGLLITRKIRRFDLVISFFVAALIVIIGTANLHTGILATVEKAFVDSPLVFFAFIMLTEPLTTPPTRTRRIWYGIGVGILFAPAIHIGSFYSTPELALLVGNIFSWILSPKNKYMLTLVSSEQIAMNTRDLVFTSDKPLMFKPGQYLEWTLGHSKSDSRGNRRYFTIASAPSEKWVRVGVKFFPEGSSFKNALANLSRGDTIMAGQLTGDFVLPKDPAQKLAFLAGGIGVTPFRSMVKHLLNMKEKRDIVLMYSNNKEHEIAYGNVWKRAIVELDLKWVNTLTDMSHIPQDWNGRTGFINEEMVRSEVPDFKERIFYISGPQAMVSAGRKMLRGMGVPNKHIRTDYFPGF